MDGRPAGRPAEAIKGQVNVAIYSKAGRPASRQLAIERNRRIWHGANLSHARFSHARYARASEAAGELCGDVESRGER